MFFPISGIEISLVIPPLVAFLIERIPRSLLRGCSFSSFTTMGGVSGAFLILPFQISVLGYSTGGYKFFDFIKIGVDMNTFTGLVVTICVYLIYF